MEVYLTEDEFDEKFNPIKNHLDENASFSGCLFETYGEELEFVKNSPQNKIWTILEADGIMFYSSGFHFVNRLGYLITEEEVEDGVEYIAKIDGVDEYQCGSCEQFFDKPVDGCCPLCGSGNFVKGCIDEEE